MIPDEMCQEVPEILLRNVLKKGTRENFWSGTLCAKRKYFLAEQTGTLTCTYTCRRHLYTNWKLQVYLHAF